MTQSIGNRDQNFAILPFSMVKSPAKNSTHRAKIISLRSFDSLKPISEFQRAMFGETLHFAGNECNAYVAPLAVAPF
jgi:hypothetical protein